MLKKCARLFFTKEAQKELSQLKLNFKDYQMVVMSAIDVAVGNVEGEEGE